MYKDQAYWSRPCECNSFAGISNGKNDGQKKRTYRYTMQLSRIFAILYSETWSIYSMIMSYRHEDHCLADVSECTSEPKLEDLHLDSTVASTPNLRYLRNP